MRSRSLLLFLALLLGLSLSLPFAGIQAAQSAASAGIAIFPSAYRTTLGSDGGQPVGNLAALDQTGTADDPTAYVSFMTPGTNYRGYRSYYLPSNVLRSTVSAIRIKVNFKGPARSYQFWSWYLYNWNTAGWVWIGDNAAATARVWTLLTFRPSSPARFVNSSTREIRLQLRSGNVTANAKLDYEAVYISYSLTPTPSPTATAAPSSTPTGAGGPTLAGCPMFPANSFWNAPVDDLPVHAQSSRWVNAIGSSAGLHMDFGSGTWDGGPIGIPYDIVSGSQTKVPVSFYYADESDPGPYPIPSNPLIEWGSDHHILILDSTNCDLYEIYDASRSGGNWSAGSGAIWDLNSNALRPETWTSADAAGLQILPGLVRYDEILAGEIRHAIRFTAPCTSGHIWPARHTATHGSCTYPPPLGARFRLKTSFDISGYPAQMQVLLRAMKTYGIILADNGSAWYISGAPDERWNNDVLHLLDDITGADFEAVDESGLIVDPNSGQTAP
jgi:glycosyl hydrolase family 114